jgi:hypothetical protein
MLTRFFTLVALLFGLVMAQCPDYSKYAAQFRFPSSGGVRNISYLRPDPACRTFNLSYLEDVVIMDVMHATPDLDLFRTFLNGQYHLLSIFSLADVS